MTTRFHSKIVAGFLGLVLGVFGAHRAYLGQRLAWLYPVLSLPLLGHALRQPVWWREPSTFALGVLFTIACLETIRIALTPAERWDARFNAGHARKSVGSVWSVVTAIVALMIGTIVLMTVMALAFETWFEQYHGLR